MSESLEGFEVAVTRQKSGRSLKFCAAPPEAPVLGNWNVPPAITAADEITMFGRDNDRRLSHDPANNRAGPNEIANAVNKPAASALRRRGEKLPMINLGS